MKFMFNVEREKNNQLLICVCQRLVDDPFRVKIGVKFELIFDHWWIGGFIRAIAMY